MVFKRGCSSWNKGLPAWNKGLTKENDIRIKKQREWLKNNNYKILVLSSETIVLPSTNWQDGIKEVIKWQSS